MHDAGVADLNGYRIVIRGDQLDAWCRDRSPLDPRSCLFTEKIIGHEIAHLLSRRHSHPLPLFSPTGPCAGVIKPAD